MSEQVENSGNGVSNRTNGVVVADEAEGAGPSGLPSLSGRVAARAAGKAAFLAAATEGVEKPVEAKTEPVESVEDESTEEAVEATDETEDEELEAEAEEEAEPEADEDDDRQQSIAATQKIDKRYRKQIADLRTRNEQIEEEVRRDILPRLEAAQSTEKKIATMKARARVDLASVLAELEVPEEDWDPLLQQAWRLSPKGKADPRNRELAAQTVREREMATQIAELKKQNEERDRRDAEREQRATVQQQVNRYMDRVAKSVSDETPLVRELLAKDPDEARLGLHRMALHLSEEIGGGEPDPLDVAVAFEAVRVALKKRKAISKTVAKATTPKTKTSPAGETKSAPTKPTSDTATKQPRTTRAGREELRLQFMKASEKGHLV